MPKHNLKTGLKFGYKNLLLNFQYSYISKQFTDEIDKILNKSIYDHITENKLNILGNPIPVEDDKTKVDWNNPSDFEFHYELGLAPEILPDLPGRLKYTKSQNSRNLIIM